MQYELAATPDGTRMRFVEHWQEGPDYRAWAIEKFGKEVEREENRPGGPFSPFHPGTLGGWHGMFDDLDDFLDGVLAEVGAGAEPDELHRESLGGGEGPKGQFAADAADRYVKELRAEESYFDLVDIYREHIRTALPPA